MNWTEVIGLVAELVSQNREMEAKIERMVPVDRFYDTALTTEMVGVLHGVSAGIVRRYIKYGLIPLHPMSTDAKLLVRGSDALSLDFGEIRKRAKFLKQ